ACAEARSASRRQRPPLLHASIPARRSIARLLDAHIVTRPTERRDRVRTWPGRTRKGVRELAELVGTVDSDWWADLRPGHCGAEGPCHAAAGRPPVPSLQCGVGGQVQG